MTKKLLLMRHGKSDWSTEGQDDFERSLAPRGRKASKGIAAWIVDHAGVPQVVLVSAARRTHETWQIVAETLGPTPAVDILRELYLASPGDLFYRLTQISDTVDSAMVIGHNPGLELLAHMLSGARSDDGAVADLARGFPTGGLAVFELASDSWSRLGPGGARLVAFVRPRVLR